MARQVKTQERLGELRVECFLADIFSRTWAAFFGAAIVHISVDVAVLLVFEFLLARYRAPALSAFQQSTKCLWAFLQFLCPAAQRQNFLHFVKKFFGDDGRMFALVHLSGVAE